MQRENVKKIADVIADYVQEDNMGEGLLRSRIYAAWDLLIADRTAAHLTPEAASRLTVRRSFRDGVLTCRMSSSVVRTQLQFQSEQLKVKLNDLLEGEYVDKIILL